jgi:hypothetical protein
MHVKPDGSFRRAIARMPLGVAGWLIPRGPVTTLEAVIALLTAPGVGLAAGWLMRSR